MKLLDKKMSYSKNMINIKLQHIMKKNKKKNLKEKLNFLEKNKV